MSPRVVYLVTCAAPPARALGELIDILHGQRWTCCVIPTPTAATWLDCDALADLTGQPVRHRLDPPGTAPSLPHADAIAVVPATFNTLNKWTHGISDTFALGILNEAIGLHLPTIAAPYAKPTLAAHPAFHDSLTTLTRWGVHVLNNEAIRYKPDDAPDDATTFHWQPITAALLRTSTQTDN